jgi:hypothetical protein
MGELAVKNGEPRKAVYRIMTECLQISDDSLKNLRLGISSYMKLWDALAAVMGARAYELPMRRRSLPPPAGNVLT